MPAVAAEPVDTVQRARVRARRRLIGAAVLVAIGVIGFPLVFETQPRPIPVDIPIEIPRKDGAAPLSMPAARTPHASDAQADAPRAAAPANPNDMITESREDAGRDIVVAPPTAARPSVAVPAPAGASRIAPAAKKPVTATAPPQTVKPPTEAKTAATGATETARARALPEDKPGAPADASRFVVQVGAFADAAAASAARQKVEKLGLKTYTQAASTSTGERIRVRVGPFATRSEADKALERARSAGLSAVVLVL